MLEDVQEGKLAMEDWGVPSDFAAKAKHVYEVCLRSPEIKLSNVWLVFSALLPHISV